MSTAGAVVRAVCRSEIAVMACPRPFISLRAPCGHTSIPRHRAAVTAVPVVRICGGTAVTHSRSGPSPCATQAARADAGRDETERREVDMHAGSDQRPWPDRPGIPARAGRARAVGPGVRVVGVNDLWDTATLAHLLAYDSTFGSAVRRSPTRTAMLKVGGHTIPVFRETRPRRPALGRARVSTWSSSRPASSAPATTPPQHLKVGRAEGADLRSGQAGWTPRSSSGVNDADVRPGASTRSSPRRPARRTARRRWSRCCTTRSASSVGSYHGARVHQRPGADRHPAQGPAAGPVGRGEHHPDQHRRRQGDRPGDPGAGGPARRRRAAGAGRGRLAGRPGRASWPRR